jgi:hypothetical protein
MTDHAHWTYWVAYRHRDGMGAVAVSLGLPIRAACQLAMLAHRIERAEDVRDVVVLSWQELAGAVDHTQIPVRDVADASDDGDTGRVARLPVVALGRVLAAAQRLGRPVSMVTVSTAFESLQLDVHYIPRASAEQAAELLAELGFAGAPAAETFYGAKPFGVRTATVDIAGSPVLVRVYCEVSE